MPMGERFLREMMKGAILTMLAFIFLKLIGFVTFSWWVVFSPWIFGITTLTMYYFIVGFVASCKQSRGPKDD